MPNSTYCAIGLPLEPVTMLPVGGPSRGDGMGSEKTVVFDTVKPEDPGSAGIEDALRV
tara:strand:- start:358 stop:531 length:174 start_codon:yes stop_codon:yes gene_type:complete